MRGERSFDENEAYQIQTYDSKVSNCVLNYEHQYGRWLSTSHQDSGQNHRKVLWSPLCFYLSGRHIKENMGKVDALEKLLSEYPVDAEVFCTYEPKADGTRRPIVKPNKPLNKWLKEVKRALYQQRKDWPTFLHGGVKKRSYVSFARPHTNKKTVIAIDIHNCFGSITQKEVQTALMSKLGMSDGLASRLAVKLCYKHRIPQGFATSSFLTNLCLNDTLLHINRQMRRRQIDMTIYVDDIALSAQKINSAEIINLVSLELSRARLAISKAKVKVMHAHKPQIICGLIVNKGVALTRQKRTDLFSDIAKGSMSEASLQGWLANLNMIDKKTMTKLKDYAIQKGLIKVGA